jgi:hypothetical protein
MEATMQGNQTSLFDALPSNGTPTSNAAALSSREKAKADRLRILEYIRSRGLDGATCDEIEVALSMSHQTASARMTGLKEDRDIETLGEVRKTRTGNRAIAYVATVKGERT